MAFAAGVVAPLFRAAALRKYAQYSVSSYAQSPELLWARSVRCPTPFVNCFPDPFLAAVLIVIS